MPAPILKVVTDTPESAHGEIDERPRPAPNATSRSVKAAAATAPPAIAGHETPDVCTSTTVVLVGDTSIDDSWPSGFCFAETLEAFGAYQLCIDQKSSECAGDRSRASRTLSVIDRTLAIWCPGTASDVRRWLFTPTGEDL